MTTIRFEVQIEPGTDYPVSEGMTALQEFIQDLESTYFGRNRPRENNFRIETNRPSGPCRLHAYIGPEDVQDPTLEDVLAECVKFSRSTFPQATPQSIATHLLREAKELLGDPNDPQELADILMLAAHLASVTGWNLTGLIQRKLYINLGRTWGEPDAEGVVEHVREDE